MYRDYVANFNLNDNYSYKIDFIYYWISYIGKLFCSLIYTIAFILLTWINAMPLP